MLIREHRLWHRGTSNSSSVSRELIGIMFLKKSPKKVFPQDDISDEVKIHSNIFGITKKGKIKEFLFLYFKPILFLYKCLISIKKNSNSF